jgi:cytochrome c peroxidase
MRISKVLVATFVIICFFPDLGSGTPVENEDAEVLNQQQVNVFSEEEIAVLRSLCIGSLPPLPIDPSNAVVDNPQAVQFGKKLFSDTRFSANNKISCATCHKAEVAFSDNKPLAEGIGTSTRRECQLSEWHISSGFFGMVGQTVCGLRHLDHLKIPLNTVSPGARSYYW